MKQIIYRLVLLMGVAVGMPFYCSAQEAAKKKVPKKSQQKKETVPTAETIGEQEGGAAIFEGAGFEESVTKKMALAEELVGRAAEFFVKTPIGKALRSFEKDDQWWAGDLGLFVFSGSGDCYMYGIELKPIWTNFLKRDDEDTADEEEKHDMPFIEDMLKLGTTGGWLTYQWNHSSCYAYVKVVIKSGQKFIIGTSFYPDSSRFVLHEMVKRAIRYGIQSGARALFNGITYGGKFRHGDIYLWAYDLSGFSFAHGQNPLYVGQDRRNWKDSRGRARNRKMIDIVKKNGSGWIDYDEDGVEKKAYFEIFTDPASKKKYIIGGGYFPTITQDSVRKFVKRAVNYIKAKGADIAMRDYSSFSGGFRQGPLRIFAYDMNYTMLADGSNPIFIGQSLYDTVDPEGRFVAREIHDIAEESGSGFVTLSEANSYKTVYFEKVEMPDGKFIIGAGYFPGTKEHVAQTLNEKACSYLQKHTLGESLKAFTDYSPDFVYGDLYVSVYNTDGICYAEGIDKEHIWSDERETTLDDKGYPIIDKIIAKANQGGGWESYTLRDGVYRNYVQLITKEIEGYVASKPKIGKDNKQKLIKKGSLKVVAEEEGNPSSTENYIVCVGYYL